MIVEHYLIWGYTTPYVLGIILYIKGFEIWTVLNWSQWWAPEHDMSIYLLQYNPRTNSPQLIESIPDWRPSVGLPQYMPMYMSCIVILWFELHIHVSWTIGSRRLVNLIHKREQCFHRNSKDGNVCFSNQAWQWKIVIHSWLFPLTCTFTRDFPLPYSCLKWFLQNLTKHKKLSGFGPNLSKTWTSYWWLSREGGMGWLLLVIMDHSPIPYEATPTC